MKALEKDRAHRYETANGLRMGIQRHLNHEPVVACPPSRLYRLRKMVRRNKLAFTAGSAVLASLVIGLSVSTISFFRERAARARANEQAAIALAVNAFLQLDLLRQADSRNQAEALFTPNPNLTVREALERAAERIGDRFKDRPLQEAAVRMSIGEAFVGLGEAQRAIPHVQRALDLRRAKLPPDHPTTLSSMGVMAWAYQTAGKLDKALPLGEKTLKLRKARLAPGHPYTHNAMVNLATARLDAGQFEQALPLSKEALKLGKASKGPDHPDMLAVAYAATGEFAKAAGAQKEAIGLCRNEKAKNNYETRLKLYQSNTPYREP